MTQTTERKANCRACNAIGHGIKTRRAIPHTCELAKPKPEPKKDAAAGQIITNNPCPECQNTEFKILNTMVKAGTKKEFENPVTGKKRTQSLNAGRYRVECTQCGHKEVVVSKHPSADPRYNKQPEPKAKKP